MRYEGTISEKDDVQAQFLPLEPQPFGSGLVPWSRMVNCNANDKLLLAYPARNPLYVAPSHVFPSRAELVMFKDAVAEQIDQSAESAPASDHGQWTGSG